MLRSANGFATPKSDGSRSSQGSARSEQRSELRSVQSAGGARLTSRDLVDKVRAIKYEDKKAHRTNLDANRVREREQLNGTRPAEGDPQIVCFKRMCAMFKFVRQVTDAIETNSFHGPQRDRYRKAVSSGSLSSDDVTGGGGAGLTRSRRPSRRCSTGGRSP
jgi:hypothetical protein